MDELYKLIDDDYELAIGAFENMQLLYEYRFANNKYTEAQKSNFLMNLGVIGEKLLKYIFGIYLLDLNNSQIITRTPKEFDDYFRASNKKIREIATIAKIDLNSPEIQFLLNYQDDNNQKGHNMDFFYNLINTLNPSYLDNLFKKFFEWKLLSDWESLDIITEEAEIDDGYVTNEDTIYKNFYINTSNSDDVIDWVEPKILLFPDEVEGIYGIEHKTMGKTHQKAAASLKKFRSDSLKKAGDSFTRFRYAINNSDNRKISVSDFYDSLCDILNVAIMIHNNKSLNFDIDYELMKYSLLHNSTNLGFTDDEIEFILNLNLEYKTYFYMFEMSNYKFAEIKEIVDYGYGINDLNFIFQCGLKLKTILSYNEQGIYSLEEIRKFEVEVYFKKMAEEARLADKIDEDAELDLWFEEQEEKRNNFF